MDMKVKGLALMLAVLLGGAAAGAVYLYVQNVKKEAGTPPNMVTVVVSKQDIPAGTKLDGLISAGEFTTSSIPQTALVQGAVTDLSQLRGRRTSTFILQGEQISTSRLQGSTQATGGILGIPEGHQAVTVQLDPQRVPAEVLQPGDHVSIYATFSNVQVLRSSSLRAFLAGRGGANDDQVQIGDYTVNLVPDVQVLRVSGEGESDSVPDANTFIFVTLAVQPYDAERLVFAQEKGKVWLALIAPGDTGTQQPPVSYLAGVVEAKVSK